MPSPFPGMDPFLEDQEWEDFYSELITDVRALLAPRLRPRYVVRVERRVYLEHTLEEPRPTARPDVPSVELTLPLPEEQRESFLTIRDRGTLEVITVVELPSPTNKRPGADGHREYLAKRTSVLRSAAHLVELDLLRGGRRLPTLEELPPADSYAVISREPSRPRARIYYWNLRDALPTIPIPLAGDDPDVPLDLQSAFVTAYDRAGYDLSLDYSAPVQPPLTEKEAEWMRTVLDAATKGISESGADQEG